MVPGLVYDVCFTTFVDDYAHDSSLDAREPVVRVLPGHFGNMVRVLVPDAAASPMEFHDIILEDLVGTPDSTGQAHCALSSYLPPASLALGCVRTYASTAGKHGIPTPGLSATVC